MMDNKTAADNLPRYNRISQTGIEDWVKGLIDTSEGKSPSLNTYHDPRGIRISMGNGQKFVLTAVEVEG